MDVLLIAVAGVLGAAFGYGADLLSRRWPEHEDRSIRAQDWRTAAVVVAGAAGFAATQARFGTDLVDVLVVGIIVAALVVLFATDLDQRLLPDVITLSIVPFALLVFAAGASPFVVSVEELAYAVGVGLVVPVALYALSIPFGRGAIGQGDLKLLFGMSLFAGATKLFYGLVVGAAAAGIVVAILVFIRRISLNSYVPYGPFLIAGMLWAILGLPPR